MGSLLFFFEPLNSEYERAQRMESPAFSFNLNRDLWGCVARFLRIEERNRVALVCKRIYAAMRDPTDQVESLLRWAEPHLSESSDEFKSRVKELSDLPGMWMLHFDLNQKFRFDTGWGDEKPLFRLCRSNLLVAFPIDRPAVPMIAGERNRQCGELIRNREIPIQIVDVCTVHHKFRAENYFTLTQCGTGFVFTHRRAHKEPNGRYSTEYVAEWSLNHPIVNLFDIFEETIAIFRCRSYVLLFDLSQGKEVDVLEPAYCVFDEKCFRYERVDQDHDDVIIYPRDSYRLRGPLGHYVSLWNPAIEQVTTERIYVQRNNAEYCPDISRREAVAGSLRELTNLSELAEGTWGHKTVKNLQNILHELSEGVVEPRTSPEDELLHESMYREAVYEMLRDDETESHDLDESQ